MNIGKSFTYIFDDPRWLNKILIGTLVLIISSLLSTILIGILGYFIIMGYALEVLATSAAATAILCPSGRIAGVNGWCSASS